jgi:hypothetical protein
VGNYDHDHYSQPEEGLVMTTVGDPRIPARREREPALPQMGELTASVTFDGLPLIQAGATMRLLTLREASPQSAEHTNAQLPLATEVKP